ncbi:MAG: Ig-like domain-containing protein, partial [Gemmatimonadaceae bacterium]
MRKSVFVCGLFLILASCNGSDGVAPLVATTLTVSTAPTSITVNGTAQASAIVKDQNGSPLTGQTIRWSSLNPSIASVDSISGVIKGLAAGTATIQGKTGTVTGSGTVLVIAPSTSCTAGPVVVDLAVGQVKVVNAADSKGCIKIATTGAASQYIVVAANTNPTPDVLGTFVLKSDEGEVVPNTSLLANPYRMSAALVVPP